MFNEQVFIKEFECDPLERKNFFQTGFASFFDDYDDEEEEEDEDMEMEDEEEEMISQIKPKPRIFKEEFFEVAPQIASEEMLADL